MEYEMGCRRRRGREGWGKETVGDVEEGFWTRQYRL